MFYQKGDACEKGEREDPAKEPPKVRKIEVGVQRTPMMVTKSLSADSIVLHKTQAEVSPRTFTEYLRGVDILRDGLEI